VRYIVWEKASAEAEIAQGKAIADAAVKAGAVQLIWSSLPNVTELSSGKLTTVYHFDSKAEVESYIRTLNIKSMFFLPAIFMQNHLTIFKPQLVSPPSFKFINEFSNFIKNRILMALGSSPFHGKKPWPHLCL